MKGWLDKYQEGGVAKTDATRVNKQLAPLNAKKVTQKELDAREVKTRRDRIDVANAVQPYMLNSPKNFAVASSAIGDKLRLSEKPNVFDDYVNLASMFGHLASGLGQVPLNIQEGNYGQAALNTLSPVAAGAAETLLSPVISKGMKSGRKAVDETFTKVGSDLARIEKEGVAKGLSPHEIKMQQMDQVGITSSQREAYVPGVSDFLHKYVRPQGYLGENGQSKLSEILSNIKKGGVNYSKYSDVVDYLDNQNIIESHIVPPREDAWRLYLGKPQKHGTFEVSQTAPIQHPSYTPEQLSNLDLYSIKSDFGKRGLFPGYNVYNKSFDNNIYDLSAVREAMPYLENPINVDKQNIIMGGHNKRLSRAGLEYNDVWDLNPTVAPINLLPSNLKPKFADSPFFVNKDARGVESLREIEIPIDKFVGKPFMTHGVQQDITSDKLVKNMRESLVNNIDNVFPSELKGRLDKLKGMNIPSIIEDINKTHSSKIESANDYLKQLESYPKFKEGGWLEKYNDGGPVQENYNDYSVSAGPGFEGDGYSNVGRNYSPAWGGQFQDGGELPNVTVKGKRQPIYVTNPNNPRLKAYKDSLTAYNVGNDVVKRLENIVNKKNDNWMGRKGSDYSEDFTDLIKHPYREPSFSTNTKGSNPKIFTQAFENWVKEGTPNEYDNAIVKQLKRLNNLKITPWREISHAELPTTYIYKKPTQPVVYRPESTPQSTIDFMEGNYGQEPITEIPQPQPQASAYGEVVDPRTGYTHMTRQGSPMYPMVGQNFPEMAMGGSIGGATQGIPGATGFMYARVSDSTPSKAKGRNKEDVTDASAENGKEMKFYQEGLDFKPKSISKNGSKVIKDDRGQWAHPGEITEIGSNQITMQGVPYPVMGVSDTGDMQMMYPNEDYVYDGESVTEIPMMREGGTISKKTLARNQRIAESNAAQNQPLTPESLATRAIAIPDKLRLSEQMRNISPDLASWMEENPTMSYIDENLNPLVIAGKLASKLGQVPLNVKQGNYRQALLNTISPMLIREGAITTENLSKSKNKFEQGGQLTKLDQLTNFTNYNTKQPGGWLDKYQ